MEDHRDPTPEDLEMLRDTQAGRPQPRTAAQGIADMQARITRLNATKRQILDRLQTDVEPDAEDPGWKRIAEINQQLTEATDRLHEYQVQQDGLN